MLQTQTSRRALPCRLDGPTGSASTLGTYTSYSAVLCTFSSFIAFATLGRCLAAQSTVVQETVFVLALVLQFGST